MSEVKYKLIDCTKEESDAFMQDFNALLVKHSVYFEPVPQFTRDSLTDPWKIVTQILLQKKVDIGESEAITDQSILSPFTEENK